MMYMRNNDQGGRMDDQLMVAAARISPQFRHLLLEIALEMADRHPNVPAQTAPVLRLVTY